MAEKAKLPYNIRRVNGQWLFTENIFGYGFPSIPQEFLIVPENLLPDTVYASGKTGYIPESQIISYFTSKNFANTVQDVLAANPQYGSMLPGGGRTPVAQSVASIGNAVKGTLSQFNETQRSQEFGSAKKVSTNTGKKVGTDGVAETQFLTFIPNADSYQRVTGDWDFAISSARSGKYSIDAANGVVGSGDFQFLFLPDRQGKITKDSTRQLQQFIDDTYRATSADIMQWQKMLGFPATGIMSPELSNYIVDVAKRASLYNWNKASSGDTVGFKPLDPMAFFKQYEADAAKKGRTKTTRTVREFSIGDARSIVEQVYQNTVGRRPTDAEVKIYLDAFNKSARKAPMISTTTESADGASATTTQKQGFGQTEAAFMARKNIEQTPEAKWVTSATTLYDAFLQAIRNPMG